ncbi:alpha/beta hydrolase [Candidatus Gottesmanbacteria bacterium]|nr:alpha/beta hydrolase [Candidatus Gottesmanbacteria bacterium]
MIEKRAIILHAWYENPNSQWYQWLKKELEKKDYSILIPDLPTMNSDLPDMEKMIEKVKSLVDENTIIAGHSLGAVLALRIAERIKYKKAILVAGWDFNDLCEEHRLFWKNMIDHKKIKSNVREIYCLSSGNDIFFTANQTENMSKRLGAKFILIKGAGHFTRKDGITEVPKILQFI